MVTRRIVLPRLVSIAGAALLAAALAGCQTDVTGAAAPVAQAAPPPLSRHEAAMECWMAVEKGRKDLPLDQRADIVTACVDRKLKAAENAAPRPDAPAATPATSPATTPALASPRVPKPQPARSRT